MKVESIFVLGAKDPEMAEIERLLMEVGVPFVHAVDGSGARVHPGNAYDAVGTSDDAKLRKLASTKRGGAMCMVECGIAGSEKYGLARLAMDHHRPGDRGYGRSPAAFLPASSLGQVISWLARQDLLPQTWLRSAFGGLNMLDSGVGCAPGTFDRTMAHWQTWWVSVGPPGETYGTRDWAAIPDRLAMTAAADHCLGAAYRGECPGVDPDELMRFRAESRAEFQGRSVLDVLADIETTTAVLEESPRINLGAALAADMRGEVAWPELPEAATRAGISYVAGPLKTPDGRRRIVCSGSFEAVHAFHCSWAEKQGLADIYGDPMRGFAGGYLP